MKKILMVYVIGFFAMTPIALHVFYKIRSAEADYEDMLMSDAGEYYDPDASGNVVETIFFVAVASLLWPFMTVVFPGLCLFDWLQRTFPSLFGYMFKDDEDIDEDEDQYL